jgi:hypothetical protein
MEMLRVAVHVLRVGQIVTQLQLTPIRERSVYVMLGITILEVVAMK